MGSAAIVVLALIGLLLVIWGGQRRLMYFPDRQVPAPAAAGLPDAEAFTFASNERRLGAWLLRAREAALTILVFNGNAGNRAYRAPLADALRERGFNVLLFDYGGFGDSEGTPAGDAIAADARAARAHVLGAIGVAQDRLVYFGESLGAAVATQLAAEHPPAALVLRSPFTSMADIGQHHYPVVPVRLLLRDRFDAIAAIQRVHAPTLVIAGDRDTIVPLEHSRRLFARSPATRKEFIVVPGAGHNDAALLDGDQMLDAIASFLHETPRAH